MGHFSTRRRSHVSKSQNPWPPKAVRWRPTPGWPRLTRHQPALRPLRLCAPTPARPTASAHTSGRRGALTAEPAAPSAGSHPPPHPGPGRRGLPAPRVSGAGLDRLPRVPAPGPRSETRHRALRGNDAGTWPGGAGSPPPPRTSRRSQPGSPGPQPRRLPGSVTCRVTWGGRAGRRPMGFGGASRGGAVCATAAGSRSAPGRLRGLGSPGPQNLGTSASRDLGRGAPGRRCLNCRLFHKHGAVGCVSSSWQGAAAALSSFLFLKLPFI